MANKDNRYFIPVDGTPIEVSEEVYRAYYQPIWNTRYHAQKNGECRCTKAQLWKCDGVCPGCPFYAAGKKVSIDTPIGGEEDGVDNSEMDESALYTSPADVAYAYERLIKISKNFTIAASFGNVHGVYKPGNVKLTPSILDKSQKYCSEKFGLPEKSLHLVFHGGSGSEPEKIREAVSYGVVKMNIDTDTQWANWKGVMDYYKDKKDYLQGQLGNPEGPDSPNKKYYDPRVWLRKGQESIIARLQEAFDELGSKNSLK